jgi:hypothetical protein
MTPGVVTSWSVADMVNAAMDPELTFVLLVAESEITGADPKP